ncbi:hypothetical protein MTO96_049044 [Rhipicephalus appendiculatus]
MRSTQTSPPPNRSALSLLKRLCGCVRTAEKAFREPHDRGYHSDSTSGRVAPISQCRSSVLKPLALQTSSRCPESEQVEQKIKRALKRTRRAAADNKLTGSAAAESARRRTGPAVHGRCSPEDVRDPARPYGAAGSADRVRRGRLATHRGDGTNAAGPAAHDGITQRRRSSRLRACQRLHRCCCCCCCRYRLLPARLAFATETPCGGASAQL